MPPLHPTTDPVRFLAPVRFFGRKAEWHCTFMVWSNNSQDSTWTPCDARSGVVRAPHGNFQCFSYPTGPVRDPCGIHNGAARHPYGHVKELTQPELTRIPQGVVCGRTGPLRYPEGLFTGCLRSVNPCGALKLIMHALKLYGPRTGGKIRMAPHGPRTGPLSGRMIFVQNCPWTAGYWARECGVSGALDEFIFSWHKTNRPLNQYIQYRETISYCYLRNTSELVTTSFWC